MGRHFALLLTSLALCGANNAFADDALKSFIPKDNLGQFIVNNFDIRTIRSSIEPDRIAPGKPTFASLGMHPKSITNDSIHFEFNGWVYDIQILNRGDMNKDGIEDIAICFVDDGSGAGGTYYTKTPLLLTRYSNDTPLVAIAYKPVVTSCQSYTR
ncbi:MAG TPA: hypothetical protein VIJ62_06305 [Rhizomicrobium sp.]